MRETENYIPPEAVDPVSEADQKAAEESLPAFRANKEAVKSENFANARAQILKEKRIDYDPEVHHDQAEPKGNSIFQRMLIRFRRGTKKINDRFDEPKVNLKINKDVGVWDHEDPKE